MMTWGERGGMEVGEAPASQPQEVQNPLAPLALLPLPLPFFIHGLLWMKPRGLGIPRRRRQHGFAVFQRLSTIEKGTSLPPPMLCMKIP